jgi:hypothetical protein
MDTGNRRESKIETPLQTEDPSQRDFKPKPLTVVQNLVLTLKILGGLTIVGLLLWLLDRPNK